MVNSSVNISSGLQRQSLTGKNDNTVAKYLEESLISLSPLNTPIVHASSRTDAGVHAISSTFSVYLELPPFCGNREAFITKKLNKFFCDCGTDIRIAWVKNGTKLREGRLPLPELDQCHILEKREFDLFKARCCCEVLKGTHDFRNFSKIDKTKEISTIRTIDELKIVPGKPYFDVSFDERYKEIQFIDIIVSSKGFLWHQVRRMVGTIIDVASGSTHLKHVQYTLYNPTKRFGNFHTLVSPNGLFLKEVVYPPEAFLEETYSSKEKFKQFIQIYNNLHGFRSANSAKKLADFCSKLP